MKTVKHERTNEQQQKYRMHTYSTFLEATIAQHTGNANLAEPTSNLSHAREYFRWITTSVYLFHNTNDIPKMLLSCRALFYLNVQLLWEIEEYLLVLLEKKKNSRKIETRKKIV